MLSEEVREAAGYLKEATGENVNTLIRLYTMLVEQEIMLVDEINHIKVTKSIIRNHLNDVGVDTAILEE